MKGLLHFNTSLVTAAPPTLVDDSHPNLKNLSSFHPFSLPLATVDQSIRLQVLTAQASSGRPWDVIGEENYRQHPCLQAAPSYIPGIRRRGKVDLSLSLLFLLLTVLSEYCEYSLWPIFFSIFCLTTLLVQPTFIKPRLFARYLLMLDIQRLSSVGMHKTN